MEGVARTILHALDARSQIEPISAGDPTFDLDAAYGVSGMVMAARIARGESPAGWKIGFTNRTIWDEYGVHAPIWGPMYDGTIHGDGTEELAASDFVEPRIEPEIVFRFARAPHPQMDERDLLSCIDAVAHGFEVVQSVYPGWKFAAADTVAAFGLHGALVHGPLVAVEPDRADEWLERLSDFTITLLKDGGEIDRGHATDVLDGPLSALRHFVSGLDARHTARGIEPGDLVTTGTVTRAFPVAAGETWSTRIDGLPLPGMKLGFG